MKIKQLSFFVENRRGSLRRACKVLADAGLDLLSLTVADTEEFGVVRVIVADWERAQKLLSEAGVMVKTVEVVAIQVPQKPGGLLAVLDVLDAASQSIEYMYAFVGHGAKRSNEQAVLVFKFADPDAAVAALAKAGISAIAPTELLQPQG
jgi:hypothetical protein